MKIVTKLLNFEQKQPRMVTAQEKLTTFKDDLDLIIKILTGKESCVYDYEIETKAQSSKWKRLVEPRLKKVY